jgi:hypothetical protein
MYRSHNLRNRKSSELGTRYSVLGTAFREQEVEEHLVPFEPL